MTNNEQYDKALFIKCFSAAYMVQAMLAAGFMYPIVLRGNGFSMNTIGWAMALFNMAAIASRPFGGWATERYGFGKSLLIAGGLSVISTAAIWQITGFSGIVIFRIGLGIASSIGMVVVSTLQGLVIPEKLRGRLFAVMGMAYILPQLTIVPLSEWLLNADMDWIYLLLPMILMVGAALTGLKMPSPEILNGQDEDNDQEWGNWSECLKTPGTLPMVMTLATFALLNSSMLQYLPLEARERGLSASLFFMFNATTCIVFRTFGKSLMDIIPRPLLGGICTSVMALSLIMAMTADGPVGFALCAVSYGCGMGLGFPVMLALIPDVFPPKLMPKGSSLGMLAFDAGFLVSPIIIAQLSNLMSLGNALSCIAGIVLFLVPLNSIKWWHLKRLSRQSL